jgi:DNA-binding beta-propeller fold protein YncE
VVDTNQTQIVTVFIVTAAAPTITSVAPSTVAAGSVFQDLYLVGTNFLSTTTVLLAGQSIPTTLASTTSVRARAPASLLASPATLTVAVQRQGSVLPAQCAVPSRCQVNVVPVRPALVSAVPESAAAGPGTVTYQFNGGFFGNGVTGEFEGQPRPGNPPPVPNPQQLQVTLSGSDLMTPGLFEVGVVNPAVPAGSANRSAVNIAIQPSALPTVTSTIGKGVLNQPVAVAVDTGLGIAAVVNGGASGVNANSISLVNLSTDTISTPMIPVGASPTGVGIDNERDLAVVVNNGNGSTPASLSIINLATNAVQTVTGVGTSAFSVGVDSIHGIALVALQSTNVATIVDLKTLPPGVSPVPCDFTATPPATSVACTSVSLVTGSGTGGTGSNPQVAVYPQLGWGIVSPGGAGAMSVVDLVNKTTVMTSLGNLTRQGLGVNSETGKMLIADPPSTFITIFSLQDQSVNTVVLEAGHVAAAANPLTNIGVTVNNQTNLASVIDLQTPTRLATVTVGTNPSAVAIDPATDQALVANQSDGTVSIINLGAVTTNPQIVQVDPTFTMTSGVAVPMTIVGSGFIPGTTSIRFNETTTVTPPAANVTSRRITTTIPVSVLARADRIVVDLANGASGPFSNVENMIVIQPVPVGTAPQGVAIDPQRDLAVVTNFGSNNISLVDLNTGSVTSTFAVGANPVGVAVLSRTGQAVVANQGSGSASVVDLNGVAATFAVSTGGQPRGVAVNPDTGFAYVSNSTSNSLSAFNITASTSPTPSTIAVDQKPGAIAIAPDLRFLLLANETSNNFDLFDITTAGNPALRFRFTDPLLQLPTGAVYDPASQFFMGISSLGNTLFVLNPSASPTPVLQSRPKVGVNPTSVAYNFQSSTLVTLNTASNTMSVMDFPNRKVRSVLNLMGSSQYAVDIHPRTNMAVVVDTANNRVLLVPMTR